MTLYAILTRKNSNHITKIDTIEAICNEWAKIKYTMAPDEEWSVKKVDIKIENELTAEEINSIVETEYKKWNAEG